MASHHWDDGPAPNGWQHCFIGRSAVSIRKFTVIYIRFWILGEWNIFFLNVKHSALASGQRLFLTPDFMKNGLSCHGNESRTSLFTFFQIYVRSMIFTVTYINLNIGVAVYRNKQYQCIYETACFMTFDNCPCTITSQGLPGQYFNTSLCVFHV